jgi:hypothetical protein
MGRTCNDSAIEAQKEPAMATTKHYGRVAVILKDITQDPSGQSLIHFRLYGDPTEKPFTAKWNHTDDMWTECPSSVGDDPKVAPRSSDHGLLYLSEEYLKTNQITAAPKWPPRLAAGDLPTNSLEIYPLRLELEGYEMRSGQLRKGTINLLDPHYAGREQTLTLTGDSPVSVQLTEHGLWKFKLKFMPSATAISAALATLARDASEAFEKAEAWSLIGLAASGLAAGEELPATLTTSVRDELAQLLRIDLSALVSAEEK